MNQLLGKPVTVGNKIENSKLLVLVLLLLCVPNHSNVMLGDLLQAATSSLSNLKLVSGYGLSPTSQSFALCGPEAQHGYPLGIFPVSCLSASIIIIITII